MPKSEPKPFYKAFTKFYRYIKINDPKTTPVFMDTAHKVKESIKDFFSKYDQIHGFLLL